jgi:hypothetical protein
LEAECHRNIEVIWLLRTLKPDFKTIADFRRDNRGAFKSVFRQFVLLCRRLDLFGRELLAVDGTRIKAVNNKDRNFTRNSLQKFIRAADERLDDYLKRLDESDLAEGGSIVAPEVGDGLEVRLQRPQKPDDLDVAMAFGLQPPARSHAVEITVDVQLQQIARRVARPAGRLRLDPTEPGLDEIETVNEGIDKPNRIIGADAIIDRFGQKQKLIAFETGNVRHARF